MTLPEFSVRRHVMAAMMSAVLILFGAIAYQDIGSDRVPDVDFPVISIRTSLSGAAPSTVDASITQFIERAVNSVPGIDRLNSVSSPGSSQVDVTFNLDKDIDVAFSEVQTEVSRQIDNLPDEAGAPIISKVEANAQPIMWLVVQGDRTLQELSEFARNTVRRQLEQISGVGAIRLGGSRNRRIRIELDADRLQQEDVTIEELLQAIGREHTQESGGFMVGGRQESMLRLDLEYHDIDELSHLVVARRGNRLVLLRDVADVVDGVTDFRSLARFGGAPAIGLGIVKIPGANTVAVVDEVRARIDNDIRPMLPHGVSIRVASDQSTFIRSMVNNLTATLLLAVILSGLVMWLFLKSLRSTLIIAAAIPVSVFAVIATIHFFGYTLNSMTMLAMLLLIGLVVDDSIVVLENVWRHRETGDADAFSSAAIGANEVYFAVIASSLSLIAIFGSVIFMEGIIGEFFESFAVVVVVGVLVSTFVALTLVPMLCSRWLPEAKQHGEVYWALERGFRRLDEFYRALLDKVLLRPGRFLGLCAAALIPAVLIITQIGGELTPDEDEGEFLVNLRTPLGSSINLLDAKVAEVEAILESVDDVDTYFAAIGVGSGGVTEATVFVRLKPWGERASQAKVIETVSDRLDDIAGVRAHTAARSLVGGGRGEPLQFHLTGTQPDSLAGVAERFRESLAAQPGIGRVDLDLRLNQPELKLVVDRERANLLGLDTATIAETVNVMIGGADIARYDDDFGGGERFRIRMKGREDQFQTPADANRIWLRSESGDRIRLDTVARFEESTAPAVVNRFDLRYAAPFYVTPDVPLGEAIDTVQRTASEVLPPGFSITLTGEAEELGRTTRAILFVLFVAVVLVYMVLGSQFNSFLQPVLVMLAMPLAMVGALIGLWVTGFTLNIFSMIGLVLLIGVVTKNSILLVDLTNQYRAQQSMSVGDALLAACPVRLRPVLMTSLTLVLAMIPAAFGSGPGSQGNASLAVTIIFGMMFSTALTLLVVPAAYHLVEVRWNRRP